MIGSVVHWLDSESLGLVYCHEFHDIGKTRFLLGFLF